jgi:hypothetical protein
MPRNAFIDPQRLAPGCQHKEGCRCDPPWWLRQPTEDEFALAQRLLNKMQVLQSEWPKLPGNYRTWHPGNIRFVNGKPESNLL